MGQFIQVKTKTSVTLVLSTLTWVALVPPFLIWLACIPSLSECLKRQSYAVKIPFYNMKLEGPVLTYSVTSVSKCSLLCWKMDGCRAFNYYMPNGSCELLGDFLCSYRSYLVTSVGYEYFDVEKNAQAEDISLARARSMCFSDAQCSPKCKCTDITFVASNGFYLQPDDIIAATVPESQGTSACKDLCAAKHLPECRGINTNANSSMCQHITFLRAERSPERWIASTDWTFYQRVCS